jgi:glycosyltransferase involved in cell wall biosynthesis
MSLFASGLAARGHDVTVFTTDVLDAERRAGPRREVLDGVRVERFPNVSNTLAWRTKKYLPPSLVAATLRRIKRFDVVHATDARTVATAAAYVAARLAGIPFCLSAHGSLPGSIGLRGAAKRVYDAAFVRPMLAQAALLFAQTDHEARLYADAGGKAASVHLLPLPVDLAEIPAAPAPGYLRSLAGFDDGAPVVLFLGRIHWLKGLDLLVDAIDPLLRRGEARLAVIGRDDGAWSDVAARHGDLVGAGLVRLLGPVYGAERFAAYADADVFALTPRHWEETSLASLEAAACGTALVLTQQADIPGLVEAGGGAVVPADAESIRAALAGVLPQAREVGEQARALVASQHAAGAVVARLEAQLERVVGGGSV